MLKQLLLATALGLTLLPARAQQALPVTAPLDVAAVDAAVARTLKAFEVPGMAVAVVKDGQVVMAKGYGVRSLATKAPVDANTLFGIASRGCKQLEPHPNGSQRHEGQIGGSGFLEARG